jgi:hypothetical protein
MLLSPMMRVLSKYRMIMGKMHIDCINKKEKMSSSLLKFISLNLLELFHSSA